MFNTINNATYTNKYITDGVIYNNIGNLTTSENDIKMLYEFKSSNGNINYLRMLQKRNNEGNDWTTASTIIQNVTDITEQGYIEFNPPNNANGISIGTSNGESISLHSNGNVGIGTNSPSQTLDISGNINFKGYLYNDGNIVNFNDGNSLLNDATFITNLYSKLETETNIYDIIQYGCSSVNFEFIAGGSTYTGSGSFISLNDNDLQYGLFMTAAHCVMDNSFVVNKFVLTNPLTGHFVFINNSDIYWDGIGDIALIRTNIDFTANANIPLKLATNSAISGDKCILCGNPLGVDNKSYSTGSVRDATYYDAGGYQVPETLFIDTPGTGGNSGSPVLNSIGEIIGIFTFGFTDYETLGGGANLSVLKIVLPALKTLAISNSVNKRFDTKFYLGLYYSTPSTFPFLLQSIYNLNDFPNQGAYIHTVNSTSPFNAILNSGDILLSATIGGVEYPFGITPGQFCPGMLIYQPTSTINIKFLDASQSYLERNVDVTLITYAAGNIPQVQDIPLSTAAAASFKSEINSIESKSKLILLHLL